MGMFNGVTKPHPANDYAGDVNVDITADNNPIVRFKCFADSEIEFIVIVKIDKVRDEGRVQHALIKELHKQFKENNIEIPFPQRVVHRVN